MRHIIVLPDGTELASGDALGDAIQNVTLTESVSTDISGSADVEPGAAAAAELVLVLLTGAARLITAGDELVLYREEDGTRTLLGHYTAEKPERSSRRTCTVYAYDNAAKLNKDLSPWLRSIQGSFPMSLYDFATAVCAQCGVTLANTSIPNGSYQVQAFYADNLTGRQLLQWVGQAAGRFLRARPDGKLEYAWYVDRRTEAGIRPYSSEDLRILAATSGGELLVGSDGLYLLLQDDFGVAYPYAIDGLTYEDYETKPLDKVQIRQSDDDVGVLYPPDETGTNAYVVQGNLLLTTSTAAALQPIAKALYELLRPVTYTPAKISLLASGVIRPGDIVRIEDANGRLMQTYVMTRTTSGGADTLESTGNSRRDSVSAVNQQTYRNLRGRMLEISASVDGLTVKASELAGNYAQLSLTVDGLESRVEDTEGNYSQLSQTVSNLTSTVAGKINGSQAQTLIDQTLQGITLSASNGSTSSTLTIKSGGTTLASAEIKLTGVVTFLDLATSGKTTINGDNITTGTIKAGILNVGTNGNVTIAGSYITVKNNYNKTALQILPAASGSGVIQFYTKDGEWCGDIWGEKDAATGIGCIYTNLINNGFLRVSRLQVEELTATRPFSNNYRNNDGNSFAYMNGSSRVGCFEQIAAHSSLRDAYWAYSPTLGGYVLSASQTLA